MHVTRWMESNHALSRDVLYEDLQILRHTLAAISDDVRQLSGFSAAAVERAIQDLDVAQSELLQANATSPDEKNPRTSFSRPSKGKGRSTDVLSPVSFPA